MPPLFTNHEKIKVIEYGQHAYGGIRLDEIKGFFAKLLKRDKN